MESETGPAEPSFSAAETILPLYTITTRGGRAAAQGRPKYRKS